MDFALYGTWEPLDSSKRLSWSMRSFSDIRGFILRTFVFDVLGMFFDQFFRPHFCTPSQFFNQIWVLYQALSIPKGRSRPEVSCFILNSSISSISNPNQLNYKHLSVRSIPAGAFFFSQKRGLGSKSGATLERNAKVPLKC